MNSGLWRGEMPSLRKTAADLEHLLEAADHEALQVQLGRDAQVEVGVERVVVGDEGPGRGAAGDGVQHRRLDLDEALRPQALAQAAHRRRCAAAGAGGCARWPTGRPRAGGSASRRRSRRATCRRSCAAPRPAAPTRHLHRQLAAPGPHHLARGPDPVAQVQLGELVEALGHFAAANSCTAPDESRSSAKASLPWGRASMTRPATATVTPDSSPGASGDQALDHRRRVVRASKR